MRKKINVFDLDLNYKVISIEKELILKSGKKSTQYKCLCNCGKYFIISHQSILKHSHPCSCQRYTNIAGKKFYRLTALKRVDNKWLCRCDCGVEKLISYEALKHNTKSCGCFNKERIKNIPKTFNSKKFHPEISSARRCWKNKYSDGNITFEQFYSLSKQNCYYCNQPPSQIFNMFSEKYSIESRNLGNFIYSGLDRIDSNLPHNVDNVVSCCYTCNRFKSNLSIHDFYKKINNISSKEFQQHIPKSYSFNKYQISNLKKIWSDSYNKEIPFDFFVSISQENCFYCNQKPSNYIHYQSLNKYSQKAKETGMIHYSGLDRFNNLPIHQINDVVPCCKHCNFAKSNMTPIEFFSHIQKIKNAIKNKQTNNS